MRKVPPVRGVDRRTKVKPRFETRIPLPHTGELDLLYVATP